MTLPLIFTVLLPLTCAAPAQADCAWTGQAPNMAVLWNQRGNAWYFSKDYGNAISDYNEAIRLDPNFARAFNNRGNAWFYKRDYDNAISDYNEAIRLDPRYVEPFNSRGNAFYFKKDYDSAIKDYDQALRLSPGYVKIYNNRGNAWFFKKDYDSAIKDYDQALRLDPGYVNAYGNRANAFNAKKDFNRAVNDFEAALRLPATSPIFRDYAFFLATCPDANFRDGKKAVALAKQACGMNSDGWQDGRCLSALAAAFAETGNFDEAVRHQQKALADVGIQGAVRSAYEARVILYQEKKPYRVE